MQANEAIEKLRAVARRVMDEPGVGIATYQDAKEVLAATATIDPPAAPVLAAVGVENQQQGNAIRPSAEPAGQLDAGNADEVGFLTEWLQFIGEPVGVECCGRGYGDGECCNNPVPVTVTLPELAKAMNERLNELIAKSAASGAASGGSTTPEVPAAQPAADHAKRAEGEREAVEAWANETQQRGPSMDDVWAIYQHGKLAGVPEGWEAAMREAVAKMAKGYEYGSGFYNEDIFIEGLESVFRLCGNQIKEDWEL